MSRTEAQPKQHRRSLANYSNANANIIEARSKAVIRERDTHIAQLQKEVAALTNKLSKTSTSQKQHSLSNNTHASKTPKRRHRLSPFGNVVHESDNGKGGLKHERSRMGRNASIATAKELNSLCYKEEDRQDSNRELVNRILEMFKDPASHIAYLKSLEFAKDLLRLTKKMKGLFESEPRVAFVQSPAYVFGDIHGNLEDLHFFSDNIWRLGMSLTAGNFVFLGDYVDRGMSCLEVIAYLFSMKLLLPHKVFLLRGNHETRDVNGMFSCHLFYTNYTVAAVLHLTHCFFKFCDRMGRPLWRTFLLVAMS